MIQMMLLFRSNSGDHSITAWLVDNDHNPVDPHVEMTMPFGNVILSSGVKVEIGEIAGVMDGMIYYQFLE